ncbi:hypothetical protein [Verrucomicrobium sp. 3C]|uniref:hypothetical protein n=1 Tax=Verrucomicrobium sp. 3C TaxID=1134055 RepID=UPI0012DFB42E|nr:hypothetical protein [Verrucomicrobium sp. 3C]
MARTPFLAIPQWQICPLRPFYSAKSRNVELMGSGGILGFSVEQAIGELLAP